MRLAFTIVFSKEYRRICCREICLAPLLIKLDKINRCIPQSKTVKEFFKHGRIEGGMERVRMAGESRDDPVHRKLRG